MALLHSDQSSYLNDIDYQSTSPSNKPLNLPPNASFDYEFAHLSTPFPHTPSYNGSYQNSPYSGHSELSYDPDGPEALSLFQDDRNNLNSHDEYDPSEYDHPNSSGLLMFQGEFISEFDQNSSHVSLSVTPAPFDNRSFDHSSPSSNGAGDESRSRASSVSSNPQLPTSSPRLDMAHSFENLRFESPHWQSRKLPADRAISPPRKPQSPPQLLIPDSSPAARSLFPQEPPMINAPDGDGGFTSSGPQLHVVPATPISGGGAASQPVPFQSTLKSLHQGSTQHGSQQQTATPPWDHQQIQHTEVSQTLGVPQFHEQGAQQFTHSHPQGLSALGPHSDPTNTFLFPGPNPRIRSKSDTSSSPRPLLWDSSLMTHEQLRSINSSAIDDSGTVNLSDVLPQHQQQAQLYSNTAANQGFTNPPHPQQFNFGTPTSNSNITSNMNYLSPDAMAVNLRRSKSDGGSRPTHNRLSRSEDIHRYPPSSHTELINRQYLFPQEAVQSIRSQHRRTSSGSRGGGDGSWSALSSARQSPYPSPSASPRMRYDELPNVALAGRQPSMLRPDPTGASITNLNVTKQTVTSERTAGASHRRRKQEANFVCQVPGCGSTFTRSFNLKGHMRSHNEERPFQCKWPGCGKGFARQHDCKRHEQLHSNYRPFTCEGCSKTFARMDALNRHLRSEGGADCQRTLDAGKQESDHGTVPKTEESGWTGMGIMA